MLPQAIQIMLTKKTKTILSIVFVIVAIFIFKLLHKNNDFIAPPTEIKIFNLSDSLKVYLNRNSKLTYIEKPRHHNLSLHLVGEAYFKNIYNDTLIIETEYAIVKTNDASFNIKSIDEFFKTDCFEGYLKIIPKQKSKKQIKISAGNSLQVLLNKELLVKTTDQFPQWVTQESSFVNAPLFEVASELERYYGKKVMLKNIDIGMPFSGTISLSNLDKALKTISESLNLHYKIFDEEIVITNFKKIN